MADNFEFDKRVQRYRYSSGDRKGQFVSFAQLEKLTADYQAQQAEQGQQILERLLSQEIGLSDWLKETAAHLKTGHINMYALGFGGHQKMGQGEYGAIGSRLKSEYEYLRNFALDIQKGGLSEQQIKARLELYYKNTWQTYERARERAHSKNGFDLERRVLAAGENCNDCLRFAAKGWVDIGTLPAPGVESACQANCRCWKDFARKGDSKTNLLSQNFGWIGNMETQQEQLEIKQMPTAIDGFYWGPPNDEDLGIIEQVTGFEWQAKDWYMAPLVASNNLMWSSWDCCWHSSVLENMVSQYPGQSLMFNHSFDVEDTEGFFARAAMVKPESISVDTLNAQGKGRINRQQIEREGFLQVILQAAIPAAETKLIDSVKTRKLQHVSTGSILNGVDYVCPHCSKALGRDVSFYEKNTEGQSICPHEIPHPYTKMMAEWGWFEDDIIFADYAILKSAEGERHYETSMVYVGNLPGAQLLRPAAT